MYKAYKTQWFSILWLPFWCWRRGVSASSGFNPCRIWWICTKLVIGKANSLPPSSFVIWVLSEFYVRSLWVLCKQSTAPLSICNCVTFVFKSLKQWCIFQVSFIGTFLGWFDSFQMYLMGTYWDIFLINRSKSWHLNFQTHLCVERQVMIKLAAVGAGTKCNSRFRTPGMKHIRLARLLGRIQLWRIHVAGCCYGIISANICYKKSLRIGRISADMENAVWRTQCQIVTNWDIVSFRSLETCKNSNFLLIFIRNCDFK